MVSMKIRNTKIPTAVLVSACLVAGVGGVAHAEETSKVSSSVVSESGRILNNQDQVTELLHIIDQIPENVLLEGDESKNRWINENLISGNLHNGTGGSFVQANFLKCSAAVLGVVASTAFPAAKILKIKRYMKALGGTTEAIKILWGASFSYEKLQALGGAAAALGAELLGITAIKEACTG